MKILFSWLKDYLTFEASAEEVAEKLNYAGIEVDSLAKVSPSFNRVVVGNVKKVKEHPNADKLSVCTVDIGDEVLNIICGAPNVSEGQKVAVAKVGAKLKNGEYKITDRKIRGVKSEGMICSEAELDLGHDESGIMVLEKEAKPGTLLTEVFPLEDYLFNLEIPSNRPDCFGVIGVAREVSAIFNSQLKLPKFELEHSDMKAADFAEIEILDADKCPRYTAKIIIDSATKESPFWLRWRLYNAGVRPISSIVDVTNYVMLETGQPLHAFDLDKVKDSKVLVRTSKKGERIITLDGVERELLEDVLLIADPEKPIGIAGIMGAESTEVSGRTSRILIESAHFSPSSIMRSSRRLGLMTEASIRFEKRVDPEGTKFAAERATYLINEISGGKILSGTIDIRAKKLKQRKIKVRHKRIEDILGKKYKRDRIKRVFSGLGYRTLENGENFTLVIPSHRADIKREIDLIEEVARIDGYSKIPATIPKSNTRGGYDKGFKVENEIRNICLKAGFDEALSTSLLPKEITGIFKVKNNKKFGKFVEVVNPLSSELALLPTSGVFGLVYSVKNNYVKNIKNLRFFEIARIFKKEKEVLPREEKVLSAAVTGSSLPKSWYGGPLVADFYDIKGLFKVVLEEFGLDYELKETEIPFLEQGIQTAVISKGSEIGFIGRLKEDILDTLDIEAPVYIGEISIDFVFNNMKPYKKYKEVINYPAVTYDVSFFVGKDIYYGEIKEELASLELKYLRDLEIFDLFEGKSVPPNKKSIALRFKFRSSRRTLTEDEVRPEFDKAIKILEEKFNAEIRSKKVG